TDAAERSTTRSNSCPPRPSGGVVLSRDLCRGGWGLGSGGARRALGSRLGRGSHERHVRPASSAPLASAQPTAPPSARTLDPARATRGGRAVVTRRYGGGREGRTEGSRPREPDAAV